MLSTKSLIGSGISGEGLVNVYRGSGKVLLAPIGGQAMTQVHAPSKGPDNGAHSGSGILSSAAAGILNAIS